MTQCLLFDCDGTLVDSEYLNCIAMSEELQLAGIVEAAESLLRRYQGANFYKTLEDLQHRHSFQLDEDFTNRFRARAKDLFSRQLLPVPGIHEALTSLKQPMSVVSNAPLHKIRHELAVTNLAGFFSDRLYSAYEVGHWKPDPFLFLHAAQKEGFAPEDCIVIEDSPVGVQAGLSAGMRVVFYNASGATVEALQATKTIRSMTELPEAIRRL